MACWLIIKTVMTEIVGYIFLVLGTVFIFTCKAREFWYSTLCIFYDFRKDKNRHSIAFEKLFDKVSWFFLLGGGALLYAGKHLAQIS